MKAFRHLVTAEEIQTMAGEEKTHFLNPRAIRINKSLGDIAGLKNIGFHIIEVEPGNESTEYHKHFYEEECVYILSGQASVEVEGELHRVKAGDFIGYPIDGKAHTMVNDGTETLVCIVVGQRLQQDVSEYPRKHKKLYRNSGGWELVELEKIDKLR